MCTPLKAQIREYIDAQGWQICENSEMEIPCNVPYPGPHVEYTFVEPYCSEVCEVYYEGAKINTETGTKNRSLYLDGPTVDGNLPQLANLGDLAVDFERTMLVYKSLVDFVDDLKPELKWEDIELGYPITQSFVARATALFFVGPLSTAGDEIMYDFPALASKDQLHILQRVMAAMPIAGK